MATLKGILGGFSGKVGGQRSRCAMAQEKNVMRSLPQRGSYTAGKTGRTTAKI
jgi:hypothetical protein